MLVNSWRKMNATIERKLLCPSYYLLVLQSYHQINFCKNNSFFTRQFLILQVFVLHSIQNKSFVVLLNFLHGCITLAKRLWSPREIKFLSSQRHFDGGEKCHRNGLDPEISTLQHKHVAPTLFSHLITVHTLQWAPKNTKPDQTAFLSASYLRLTFICLFFGSRNKLTRNEITEKKTSVTIAWGIPFVTWLIASSW